MDIDTEAWMDRAERLVRSRPFLIAAALFVAAFAVRWVFVNNSFWIDEGRALMIAKNLLRGEGFVYSPTHVMVKHPWVFYTLMAASMLVLGVTALAGLVTTNVLAALTVVMVFLTGRELFNDWAGAAAGVLMLFVPVHVFFSTRILTDAPVTFFVALTLYFWVRTEQRDERWSFYAMFVAAALTILTKLTGIVVLPAMFVYYLYKEREELFLQAKYWYGAATVIGLYGLWEVRNLLTVGYIGIVDVFLGRWLSPSLGGQAASTPFLEGAVMHVTNAPQTFGLPAVILFAAGLVFAYVYGDDRFEIPLIFMAVTFLVLATKGRNRYFLPFWPMGAVVAGYAVDRLRRLAAGYDARAGHVVFAAVLLVSAGFMVQGAATMVQGGATSFTGLKEAGEWIKDHSHPDDRVVAASSHQIRFFSDRETVISAKVSSQEELHRMVREEGVRFVEWDAWEFTKPDWFTLRTMQRDDLFRPVHVVRQPVRTRQGVQRRPVVVVYAVNGSVTG